MIIKKQDKVLIISGKNKGKTGSVLKSIPKENKIVVEGVNIQKRHMRSRSEGRKGEIIEKNMPIDASNAKIICSKCGKPARVGMKILEAGTKARICKKCGGEI